MDAFPIPAEQVMLGEVHARLSAQEQAVNALTEAMAAKYRELSAPAHDGAETIKRNAKRAAQKMVKGQGDTVADLIQTMGTQAGAFLVQQEAQKEQLQDAMFRLPAIVSGGAQADVTQGRVPPRIPQPGHGLPAPTDPCAVPWFVVRPMDATQPCYISYVRSGDPNRPGQAVVSGGGGGTFPTWQSATLFAQNNCPPASMEGQANATPPYPLGPPYAPPGCHPTAPGSVGAPPVTGRPGSVPPSGGGGIPRGAPAPGVPAICQGVTPLPGCASDLPGYPREYMDYWLGAVPNKWYAFVNPCAQTCVPVQADASGGVHIHTCQVTQDGVGILTAESDTEQEVKDYIAATHGCYPSDSGPPPPPDNPPPDPPFIPPPPPPTQQCATPGSSCDCPLYVVTCAPPADPLPSDTCDTESDSDDNNAMPGTRSTRRAVGSDGSGGPSSGICFEGASACDTANVPVTGSEDWCAQLPKWVDYFHGVGANLLGNLDDPASLAKVPGGGPGFSLQSIATVVGVSLGAMKLFITSMYDSIHAVSTGNACAALGVWFARWCLSVARNFEVGIKFVAHLTVHLGVEESQLTHLLDYVNNFIQRGRLLSHAEIWEAYRGLGIEEERMRCLLAANGVDWGAQGDVLSGTGERLSVHEIIQFGRRQHWDDDRINAELSRMRSSSGPMARRQQYLYDELPTIQDHLHWLARNVDDTDYVQKYALLDGFSTNDVITSLEGFANYTTTTETHGRDFWKAFGDDLRAQGMKIEYAAKHYAAHWIQPAPTQMREFVYRLSPDLPGVKNPFTTDDFKRILTEQDYAPKSVQWFSDTVYHVMAPTYARELFNLSIIDEDRYRNVTREQGYSKDDAALMLDAALLTKKRQRASQAHLVTSSNAGTLVRTEVATKDELLPRLLDQGYQLEELTDTFKTAEMVFKATIADTFQRQAIFATRRAIQEAHTIGTMSDNDTIQRLMEVGSTEKAAQAIVSASNATFETGRAKAFIRAARKAMMDAEVTADQAAQYLTDAGVQPERANDLVDGWQLELDAGQRILSAGQVLSLLRECLISPQVAQRRLLNLNWSPESAALIVAQAGSKCQQLTAKRLLAAEKSRKQAIKELQRLEKEAAAERKRIQREIMRQEPESLIKRLYVNGRVTDEWVTRRLLSGGYDPSAISARLHDWHDARERAQEKAKGKAQEVPPAGEPGGVGPRDIGEPIPSHPGGNEQVP